MPIEFHRDGPWELPEGWVWARAGDVLPLEYGKGLPGRARDSSGSVPVYGSAGVVGTHSKFLVDEPCLIIARKGSVGAIFETTQPSWPIDTVYFARESRALDRRYAYWFILFARLDRLDQSTAVPSLSRDKYNNVLIPIAPLAEQTRIVARIDELFTDVADGETALTHARDDLDTWRRSLFKAAVTGELTREWREHNNPNRTGQLLLDAIQSKKRSTGRVRRNEELEPIELPEIPSTWIWATIGDVITFAEYGTSEKCDTDGGGVPVLRMGNIQNGTITFAKMKFLPPEPASGVPILELGDILFNRTNSEELVGKSAVVESLPGPTSFASYLIRLRVEQDIEPAFMVAWINSAYGRAWIRANKSQQVGQANLSGGKLRSMPFPIAPPEEQSEIVRRLAEAIDVLADQIVDLGAAQLGTLEVRQSILKTAFEGRLVDQDSRDEPADHMLARFGDEMEIKTQPRQARPKRSAMATD